MLIVLFKIAVAILLPAQLAQALFKAVKKRSSSPTLTGATTSDKQTAS
jgi:hypothetical protein